MRRAPKVSDLAIGDNELESLYVGLNYYYSKAVTFMAGYENAENSDNEDIDGLRARVQVLW